MLRFVLTIAALATFSAPAAAQSFAFGWIDREGQETREGPHAPPWKRTKVQANFFGVPAAKSLSGPATILPHDPALPPATLPILTFGRYQKEECTGLMSKYRSAEFPDLPGEAYLRYVQPGQTRGAALVGAALVVHPARPAARTLPKQSVAAGDMPKGYPLATLEAAFDLSGGGRAEVVKVEYCCHNPAFTDAQCAKAGGRDGGARCAALFLKGKAGWRRVFMTRNEDR